MDLETEAAQRVGTTLCNKWTLERLIGTGGMAAVYVANHKIGRREAIKILHSDVARDPELRARFEQEASAVNHFKHPGAVEVRDIDVAEDGTPFLVMELLDGQPLSDLARRPSGVEPSELLRMSDELLDVLAAAHAQGIIHRDIKPDNLFVLQDGRLKVLDFGIARVRAGAPSKLSTRVGATLGTAPYMPPEQIRGVEIDARADLFAVGATMFRLISRRRIHEAGSEAETLIKMASLPAPPLASAAPDAPRDVCLVVDRALMFDREQRYPDALTMQRDVRALRDGQPPPYATAHAPAPGAEPARPLAPIAAMGVGATAVALGDAHTMAASPVALSMGETPKPPAQPVHAAPVTAGPGSGRLPAASDAVTQRGHAPAALGSSGEAITAPNPPAQPVSPGATAVSLGEAPQAQPVSIGAMTPPPASIRTAAFDPVTRQAMMVLGASGLSAPLASQPSPAAAAGPEAPPASRPAPSTPSPAAQQFTPGQQLAPAPQSPLGERTLRSVQGPEVGGAPVPPQGVMMATTTMPQAQPVVVTAAADAGHGRGPRTQLSGVAPPSAMAPGESVPVMAAPPPPPRQRLTLPGTEISVLPLVLVGVLFAAIGVSVTLWFMLHDQTLTEASAAPSSSASASVDHGDPTIGPRGPAHPATLPGAGQHPPQIAPANPTPPVQRPPRHYR